MERNLCLFPQLSDHSVRSQSQRRTTASACPPASPWLPRDMGLEATTSPQVSGVSPAVGGR